MKPPVRIVVVGGSDAGISAALRARELQPEADVTLFTADAHPNFSICGLPFFLGGEVPDWRNLAHRSIQELTATGIQLRTEHRAVSVDPHARQVWVCDPRKNMIQVPYDRLIIATGAVSARPHLPGMDLPGVFLLRWITDALALQHHIESRRINRCVILGGGYIGIEMAEAWVHRGLEVTLVEMAPAVMPTLDPVLGQQVQMELERKGVRVTTGRQIERIELREGLLVVTGDGGWRGDGDMVLAALGCRPETSLAAAAGIRIGARGAIVVDRRMQTNIPGILAAGDCAETWHRLLQTPLYLPLGTTAHKQGRVAGANAVGHHSEYAGSLGTQVVRVFDLVAGRTGLLEREARAAGFEALTSEITTVDHKAYCPGARALTIRVTGDRPSGRLLGAQIVGHRDAQVAKRIDIFATALHHGMRLREIAELDLSYTPPLSSPWDPVQMAAMQWCSLGRTDG